MASCRHISIPEDISMQETDFARSDHRVLVAMRYGWTGSGTGTDMSGDQVLAWLAQAEMPSAKRRRYAVMLRRPLVHGTLRASLFAGLRAIEDGRTVDLTVVEAGVDFAPGHRLLVIETEPSGRKTPPGWKLCDGRDWKAPALWLVPTAVNCPSELDELAAATARLPVPAA
jgi:hypothetical protein